ncbi:unnamed protein product [Strongylus vulgaris]|uniref:Fibronectin type-III domain-containing protein n=1 Tax=Strongylus vulgaris TaxID=40348 RepID=A0A3P7LNF9_STRVU|nr:unnamed protein product [Strongylus vulgaris]
MCAVETSPNAFATVSIATTCRVEWPKVSPCLADGRNHTECCQRKGVQKDCLPICAGSTESLGVHSVLCLNLDLQAIYQCLREGYETHPSPPVNVTVTAVSESSAEITWAEPDANPDLVETFTLMIRKVEHGSRIRETHPSPPVNVTVTAVSESSAEITWAEPDANPDLVETFTLMIRKVEHGSRIREIPIANIPFRLDQTHDEDSLYPLRLYFSTPNRIAEESVLLVNLYLSQVQFFESLRTL